MSFLKQFFGGKSAPQSPVPQAAILTDRPVDPPGTALSELLVRALIPVTKENQTYVKNLMKKAVWLPNDPDLNAIMAGYNPDAVGAYVPCDDPARPYLMDGNKTRIQMWERKGVEPKGRSLVMVKSAAAILPEGKILAFRPTALIRGTGAPFVMIYRMSCCGEESYSALVSVGNKNGNNASNIIDSNLQGIKEGMGSGVFFDAQTQQYRIGVAKDPESEHQLEILHGLIRSSRSAHSRPGPQAAR
jgi:hypothetical protein